MLIMVTYGNMLYLTQKLRFYRDGAQCYNKYVLAL